MTFSNAKQIAVLVLLWSLSLFAVDRIQNPRRAVFGSERVAPGPHITRPHVRLWMNHVCCSGCLSDVEAALAPIPWLGRPVLAEESRLRTRQEADEKAGVVEEYRQVLQADVLDLDGVDFMEIVAALTRAGFAAERLEFAGVSHYRLEAEMPHFCCNACARGSRESLEGVVAAARARGYFGWLDSFSVEKINKVLTFYPRFDEPVDVAEIVSGLERIGFTPASITLQVDERR